MTGLTPVAQAIRRYLSWSYPAVGVQHLGPPAGPAGPAATAPHRRDGPQQRHDLGDVVAVATGQGEGEGDAVAVGDDVVLGARLCSINRARTRFGPPFSARM